MGDKPWMERCYIPCPHCKTLNDVRLWSKWNAIGNWLAWCVQAADDGDFGSLHRFTLLLRQFLVGMLQRWMSGLLCDATLLNDQGPEQIQVPVLQVAHRSTENVL